MEKTVFGIERPTAQKISEGLNKAGMSFKQTSESFRRLSEAWSRFEVISTLAPHRKVDK